MTDSQDRATPSSAAFDAAGAFAEVAKKFSAHDDLPAVRVEVATLARDTLGSAGTAIWHLKPDASMALDSFTDPAFMKVMSDIVGGHPDGPAWQAMQDRKTTVADDFSTENRWPGYTRRLLAESQVRSAVVYPLGLGGKDLGVLAVYSHQPRYFGPSLVDLGAVFAAYASLALENVALAETNRHLEKAVASHRRIGIALGILMSQHQLTEQQAFDLLRVASSHTNTKLALVAEDVILTGTIRSIRP